jgi:hypothetical protein
MTEDPYADLARLAREATPGPYELEEYADGWLVNGDGWIVVDYSITEWYERERHAKDAAYFAAASPDIILALLEERRVLREVYDAALTYRNLVFGDAGESDTLEAWAMLDSLFLDNGEPYPAALSGAAQEQVTPHESFEALRAAQKQGETG